LVSKNHHKPSNIPEDRRPNDNEKESVYAISYCKFCLQLNEGQKFIQKRSAYCASNTAVVLYFGIATCFGHFRISSVYQYDKKFNVIYYTKFGYVYKVTCFLRHCNLSQIITVDCEFPSCSVINTMKPIVTLTSFRNARKRVDVVRA
jgi:hypothetical protein